MISPAFDPVSGATGGAILALASSTLLALGGRLVGVSGSVRAAVEAAAGSPGSGAAWHAAFLGGLLCAGAAARLSGRDAYFGSAAGAGLAPAVLAAAGFAVGAGTALAAGCTSGHGLCGLARLSPRSAAAVATFMAAGAAAASVATSSAGAAALRGAPLTAAASGAAAAAALLAVPLVRRLLATAPAVTAQTPPSPPPPSFAVGLAGPALAFGSALLFGAGLLVSGMCNPAKVRGFLAPLSSGGWDPSLAFVMGSGVLINLGSVAWAATHQGSPLFPLDEAASAAPLASNVKVGLVAGNIEITPRLLLGSALFGAGWGLSGACPGPAVVSLGAMQPAAFIFVPFMALGSAVASALTSSPAAASAGPAPSSPAVAVPAEAKNM